MKRREFIVGMAGVVAARNTPAAVCFGSPVPIKPMTIPHDRWHSGIVSFDDQWNSMWLRYPSDPEDSWLSLGVLTGVRHKLLPGGL